MARIYAPPAQMDIRTALARDALAAYARWEVTAPGKDAPVVLGKLASSLELLLEAVSEAGL